MMETQSIKVVRLMNSLPMSVKNNDVDYYLTLQHNETGWVVAYMNDNNLYASCGFRNLLKSLQKMKELVDSDFDWGFKGVPLFIQGGHNGK